VTRSYTDNALDVTWKRIRSPINKRAAIHADHFHSHFDGVTFGDTCLPVYGRFGPAVLTDRTEIALKFSGF
jgi:hypothetical protein